MASTLPFPPSSVANGGQANKRPSHPLLDKRAAAADKKGMAIDRPPFDLDRVPRLRLVFGERRIVGPGRADLLEGIAETGSIAAAGRRMRMSYKRAWSLIEELNATFDTPLVSVSRGGSGHGGAALTELGAEVHQRYRRMQAASDAAISADLEALARRLGPERTPGDMSEGK